MQLWRGSGAWFRKEGTNRESTTSLAQGQCPAQPLCASVNEMIELLNDAIHHDHDVFRVPGAQRNQDNRKYLAHDCFLFYARSLAGPWP